MKLLYLTEDYIYSKVHNNLLYNMLEWDPNLIVYVVSPVRKDNPHGLEDSFKHHDRLIEITPRVDIPIWLYKYDFWAKLRCKLRLIEKYVPIKEIDAIHAATLYTEGTTAFRLNKKYGIPYFASIRGADIMFYARKMPHLWLTGIRVMKNAEALFCVTPAIKDSMAKRWQHRAIKDMINDSYVVNNGIDSIWLNSPNILPRPIGKPARILYIGRFDANKNVLRLIEAIKEVKKQYDITLTLVGGKGEEHEIVLQQVTNNSGFMEYLGPIYNKEELINVVKRCDIFAMISHSETFGLVYAECLSQGLPVLYTKRTGFDGMYPNGEVGYGVESYSVKDICEGLKKIIDEYPVLRDNIMKIDLNKYSWPVIAKEYISVYNKSIRHDC